MSGRKSCDSIEFELSVSFKHALGNSVLSRAVMNSISDLFSTPEKTEECVRRRASQWLFLHGRNPSRASESCVRLLYSQEMKRRWVDSKEEEDWRGDKNEGEKENEVGSFKSVEWVSSQDSCQAPSSFERCAVGYLWRYGEEREEGDENGFECYSSLILGRMKLWEGSFL